MVGGSGEVTGGIGGSPSAPGSSGGDAGHAGGGTGGATVTGPAVDPPGERCDGAAIRLGEMQIFPNEWNDGRADTCVFLEPDGTFGWRWSNGDFSAPAGAGGASGLMGAINPDWPNYPELEFGINPWNARGLDRSTTTLLPKKLGEITSASMTVNVKTVVGGTGKWNLAFELWLSDENPVENPGSKALAEVMVFFGNIEGYYPAEPQTSETLDDGERVYTLYQSSDTWGDEENQKYRQYRLGGAQTSFEGKLNIGKFLDHYKQQGWSQDLWVTRFELGNEVYSGSTGTTTIHSVSFEVNGEVREAQTMP